MSQGFRFLVHKCFQKQLDSFAETNPDAWSSLLTQFRKARDDPFRAGKAMSDIPVKKLQGCIYRLHVKGRRGFRFIYLIYHPQQLVMGVFVSSEIKAKFDYNSVPWLEYATEIYKDIVNRKYENFKEFKFAIKR